MNITRQMIAAAHDVTMRHKIVLGHELLGEIYQAMKSASPAQRKPLTDEEIWDEVKAADLDWQTGWSLDEDASNRYITFARAIEAAHGIKGDA